MLILKPTLGNKVITIAPRSNDLSGSFSMNIRRDGDGKEEVITDISLSIVPNFVELVFEPTILQEDSTFYMEITRNDKLWYRDKIYATSQTVIERADESHKIGNDTIYKTYSKVDDNTYII